MLNLFRSFFHFALGHANLSGLSHADPGSYLLTQDAKSVSRVFQIFEALALSVAGAYAVLVSVVLFDLAWMPLWAGVGLLAMGGRRWLYPARQLEQWSRDALLALALVALAATDLEAGAGNGPLLFLIATLAITFPAWLKTGHALGYAFLLLCIHFLFSRWPIAQISPWLFGLRGALLAALCLISGVAGYLTDRSKHALNFLRHDIESGALNEHGWLKYGTRLAAQCEQDGRSLSFALLPLQHNWYELAHKKLGLKRLMPKQVRLLKSEALADMAFALSKGLPSQSIVGRNASGDWVLIVAGWNAQQLREHLGIARVSSFDILFGPPELELSWTLSPVVIDRGEQESLIDLHTRAMSQYDHPPSSRRDTL